MTGCSLKEAAIAARLHGTASRLWLHSRPDAVNIPITTTDCTTSVLCTCSISSLRPKKINQLSPGSYSAGLQRSMMSAENSKAFPSRTTRLRISQLSLVVVLFASEDGWR